MFESPPLADYKRKASQKCEAFCILENYGRICGSVLKTLAVRMDYVGYAQNLIEFHNLY
jgi:hypothetical protein